MNKVVYFKKTNDGRARRIARSCMALIIAMLVAATLPASTLIDASESYAAASGASAEASATKTSAALTIKKPQAKAAVSKVKVTKKEINSYLGKSGFIGSSTSVGLRMYFDSKGKNYLGNPTMMMRTSYSFANDRTRNHGFMIKYKGRELQARKAVKKSGIKRAFICMGTNDLNVGASAAYSNYKRYLRGIRADNPGVVIFVEATTPMRGARGSLNNGNIKRLNRNMKKYCAGKKDMYFVDIATPLSNKAGSMKSKYSSDNYVHLTMAGYRVWTNRVVKDVKLLLLKEKRAEAAVKATERTLNRTDYKYAKARVLKLEKSTVRTKLIKRLNKARNRIYKAEAAAKKAAQAAGKTNQAEASA